ncbi:Uncharacterized protein OBRU01_10678 [Operophtera brumata]|uniref:Uncharacterized protein n=1 Tax=Operophtera brumata TaxID=104452 RepID=A0A0L7L698_OPEBR|nr:Uncharacterized protein OBRU01_10678 [Operophtera brumata]
MYITFRLGVDCSLELMFLATLREHRQKKLGYLLCKYSLDVGRRLTTGPVSHISLEDLGPKYSHMKPREVTTKIPKICQAIGTSIATQKIGAALNFTVYLRVSFTEYEYDGKNYVERNGFDPYCEGIAQALD